MWLPGDTRDRKGFSLIEVLAAMAILSIGLLCILAIFPWGMKCYQEARDKTLLANMVRAQVSRLNYELSDPEMTGLKDKSEIVRRRYLDHDKNFARYMSDKKWSGPVLESEVYPFEDSTKYYWQYMVTDIGQSGDTKIGDKGVKGVFFQVEFKVYLKDQIESEKTPLALSIVKKDDREKPFLRQVFRVHNPYPALKYGEKVGTTKPGA